MNKVTIGKAHQTGNKGKYRVSYWMLRGKGIEFQGEMDHDKNLTASQYKALENEYRKEFARNSRKNYDCRHEAIKAFYLHLSKLSKSEGWREHYDSQYINLVNRLS